MRVWELLEVIREELEYAKRQRLLRGECYWQGYMDALNAIKRILETPTERNETSIFEEIYEEMERERRRWRT
ncbi:MAG: hypothetical protein DRN68_02780 [Thaumarchaeota archaeon]|mgnify:CR=1 FL=1|nr:MAG: hypothetical protein DRN68_02780 [Nitrososphaerota archaeon]